jgi:transposase-like protein
VKVGGRKCWIFAAIDPATRRVLYLRAFRERGLWQTCQFFQELRRLYGRWAAEAIVDSGPWYQGALWRLGLTSLRHWLELYAWHYNQFLMERGLSAPS